MIRVLLVEDDRRLAGYTAEFLSQRGMTVEVAPSGTEALSCHAWFKPDLVLLDLTLPGLDGIEVAKEIRRRGQCPIIMVTARDRPEQKIEGLDVGADDYLAKPYDPRELLARIRAVWRRVAPASATASTNGGTESGIASSSIGSAVGHAESFRTGDLEVRFASREVFLRRQPLELTSREFDLLAALARKAGEPLSRDALLDALRGPAADEVFDRSIDVTMSRLRQKLEPEPRRPTYLKTVRNSGYLLVVLTGSPDSSPSTTEALAEEGEPS
jgi:DNA-binding response OmpR family regulator